MFLTMKEYFYTITEGMINLGLRGTELNLFAIIFGYSQKGDGCCYTSRRELARRCGVSSTNTIDSAMDSLMEKGLVKKFIFRKDDREMIAYSYNANFEQGTQILSTPYSKNAQGGCAKIEHNENNNNINTKEKVFVRPTREEVHAYCKERNNNLDPDYFYDKMEAVGWTLKSGQKVKDWKAVIRTWEKYDNNTGKSTQQQVNTNQFQRLLK